MIVKNAGGRLLEERTVEILKTVLTTNPNLSRGAGSLARLSKSQARFRPDRPVNIGPEAIL